MNTNDLALGFDPSALSAITGAQLASLITTATPSSDRGMCLFTTDITGVPVVPAANSTTEWQRFVWIRVSPATNTVTAYIWNPGSSYIINYNNTSTSPATPGSINTNWTPLSVTSIPAGSITGSQIANTTIEPANIDLGGLLTALGLTPSSYLTTSSVPLASGNIGGSFGAGLTINNKIVTAAMIFGGTSGQIPQVTDNTNDVGWVSSNTVGRVLQIVNFDSATPVAGSVGAVLINNTSTPLYNSTGMIAAFNTTPFSKIDTTGQSKLLIELFAQIGIKASGANVFVFVGVYAAAGATAPLCGTSLLSNSSGTDIKMMHVYTSYLTAVNPSNATYYIAFGSDTASASWMNAISAGLANPFLITKSTLRITEYI